MYVGPDDSKSIDSPEDGKEDVDPEINATARNEEDSERRNCSKG